MKRLKVVLAGVVLILVVGCGTEDGTDVPQNPGTQDAYIPGEFYSTNVDVNGRQIPCVIWNFGDSGGISCDWNEGENNAEEGAGGLQ